MAWLIPIPQTGRFAQVLTMGKPWQPSDPSLALATPSPSCSFRGARKEFWSTIGAAARTSPKKMEQKRVDHAAWSENVGKILPILMVENHHFHHEIALFFRG